MPDSGPEHEGHSGAPLSDQLARLLLAALEEEGISQADLARSMGLSAKHINHMAHGKSGALGMYDFAAFTLGRRWRLSLEKPPPRGAGA